MSLSKRSPKSQGPDDLTTGWDPSFPSEIATVQVMPPQARTPAHKAQALAKVHAQHTSDLQVLLRRRLRLLAVAGIIGYTLAIVRMVLMGFFGPATLTGLAVWIYCVLTGMVVLFSLVLVVVLSGKRPISLLALRKLELALLFSLAAVGVWVSYQILAKFLPGAAHDADTGGVSVYFVAASVAIFWVMLILAYGICIPNTWRRSVVVVTLLVCCAVVTGVAAAWRSQLGTYFFFYVLVSMSAWTIIAGVLSVYGSHRVEVLRQQALEMRKLGQYQLKKFLGSGGMGEVYLAEHVLLRRPCAVKLIRPERAGDPDTLLRFEREVKATATLTNLHTVEIYDYGRTDDGTFYCAMEYLPGLNLEQFVQQYGPLPAGRTVYLLVQVCSALQEAHDKGLIHRDIKPSNIILAERGGTYDVAKLLDFGLVRTLATDDDDDRLTQEGTITGTPAYMSPEQAEARRDIDSRTDIYSLGTVAYFLFTGRPPFVRENPMQTLVAHIRDAVEPLSSLRQDVPDDLHAVVVQCLEKERDKRFADVQELKQALEQCQCANQWTEGNAAAWWRDQQSK